MGDPLERGDRSYAARGESNDGRGHVEPQRIGEAITAYEEALAILEAVVRAEPRAELVVEDQATREMARERLDRERKR